MMKYVLSKEEPETPLQWKLECCWAVACPVGKTAVAVCWWAREKNLALVTEVRWTKPASGSPSKDWRGEGNIHLETCAAYAHTIAKVKIFGEKIYRKVRVVFYQEYQACGLPVTHGKGWYVTEVTD